MLDISQIQDQLRDRNLSAVAREVGMPYPTLYRLARGDGSRVLHSTVAKLSDYLLSQQRKITPFGKK